MCVSLVFGFFLRSFTMSPLHRSVFKWLKKETAEVALRKRMAASASQSRSCGAAEFQRFAEKKTLGCESKPNGYPLGGWLPPH